MTTDEERNAALDERIRGWPAPPLPEALSSRVHALARAALEEGRGARRAAGFATAAAVVSAVALYLSWAVRFLSALAQG